MENQIETHKILDEYPDYCIFRDGVVWNVAGNEPREIYGYIDCKSGYKRFTLRDKNRKQKTLEQHRLLGLAFILNPNNLEQIDHVDGNTSNNNLENLRWVSRSQNLRNRQVYQINENTQQSGFKYVNWNTRYNIWQGNISINGKNKYIGIDEEPERLYIKCLKKLYEVTSDYDLQFECNQVKDDLIKYRIDEMFIQR
jgi:hypothetical protein